MSGGNNFGGGNSFGVGRTDVGQGQKLPIARPKSHVHFPAEQVIEHTADIVIRETESGHEIHLGFLQIKHRYEIQFDIPNNLGEHLTYDSLQNIHVRVKSIVPSTTVQGHNIVLVLTAHKEKLMNEKVTFTNSKNESLNLILFARVLGKGKGKPSLRSNIHLLKPEPGAEPPPVSPSFLLDAPHSSDLTDEQNTPDDQSPT